MTALAVFSGCGPSLVAVTPDSAAFNQTVEVREFADVPTAEGAASGVPGPTGAELTHRVVQALRAACVKAVPSGDPDSGADMILEGGITEITRGSRGLRYVGGAGAARLAVHGRALRRDGIQLGVFGISRSANFGLFGGNGDLLLSNCVDAVVHDIANMVVSGDYEFRAEEDAFKANVLVRP